MQRKRKYDPYTWGEIINRKMSLHCPKSWDQQTKTSKQLVEMCSKTKENNV